MKRSMTLVALVITAATIVASTAALRSQSHPIELATTAMPSLEELHAAAGASRLDVQHIEDLSVIFPSETKQ
jgi:hypothetical protein